ncbi:MAG: zinc dependent phospholipase C family protein [Anaerolineales bacterium]|nr:zinc dependent phospholipase C family protein [Anaerolineales bacterium]
MGTWICHLRIADKLLKKIDNLDPEMFAIGNIAPDSGIADEKWQTFTPPKHITHFGNEDETWGIADLDFYRKYLKDVSHEDCKQFSFLLGYFFHLITDNLWAVEIWRPHKEKYADWFAKDVDDFVRETKRDWYGLDFIYVRDYPHALFWQVFLHCKYETNYLYFVPIEAVQQRVAYIQQFYQETDAWVQAAYLRPYLYLPKARMDQFVEDTSQFLFRVYKALGDKNLSGGEAKTILEIISFRS